MRIVLHIVKKELIQFIHDKKMFVMSFIPPVIQLIVLGYAASLDVRDIPLVVCDRDNSASSRYLVENFVASGYFRIVAAVGRESEVDRWLDNGQASIALIIPRGYERKLANGQQTQVQCIADGSETTSASTAFSYAMLIVQNVAQNTIVESLVKYGAIKAPPRIISVPRIWYNPELKSRNFMVPGVLGLLLVIMTMILTSMAIVREKEMGTLEQLIVTPVKPIHLIVGKLLPFLTIGMIDVFLVVVFTTLVFDLPVKGGVLLLFVLCGIFLLTTLGLGLFISTISRTQQQAMMTAIFFFILPMIFFSGFVFPIENMPRIIQFVSYFLPLRYFFVIVRGLFLKGVGLTILWPQVLALLIFGISIFTLSVLRFRKRLR
ncbi:MAG: ABC transporter permease [Bacteroidetes bacterium]|nr:ABC transporter permease [Bacteroidota bacterium]